MDKLKIFLRGKINSRIKNFYKSSDGKMTAGYLKGTLKMGEEETAVGTVTWNGKGIFINKEKFSWHEADRAMHEIINEKENFDSKYEQLSLF